MASFLLLFVMKSKLLSQISAILMLLPLRFRGQKVRLGSLVSQMMILLYVQSSFLFLPNSGISGVHHHPWLPVLASLLIRAMTLLFSCLSYSQTHLGGVCALFMLFSEHSNACQIFLRFVALSQVS